MTTKTYKTINTKQLKIDTKMTKKLLERFKKKKNYKKEDAS